MKLREKQKKQSMFHIGEVALNLFFENGFNNTKVSDIASKADVSVGLISYYFGSKEKLFENIIGMSFGTITEINENLEKEGSPLKTIEYAGQCLLEVLNHDNRAAKIFSLIYDVNSNPQANQQIRKLIPEVPFHIKTSELITKGQQSGEIRPGNPKLLARLFWDSFALLATLIIENEEEEIPAIEWFSHILANK